MIPFRQCSMRRYLLLRGSVSQVRESTGILMQIAKVLGIEVFVVGHVTKEGVVAGPRVLEHMVDLFCILRETVMEHIGFCGA